MAGSAYAADLSGRMEAALLVGSTFGSRNRVRLVESTDSDEPIVF